MPEEQVTFTSKGLKLAGNIRVPDNAKPGEKRPAFIVLHGFGSTRHAGNVKGPCEILDKLGYATMRFDMPGCGDSEGERGRLICLEQVQATSDALTTLAQHPGVDGARIAVAGSSFGAAVAVYTGGVDKRVAAVVSASGWGHGERKFRKQHPTPEGYAKFTAMLEEGKTHRARTGQPLMVPRYDIVPIPEHLRTHVLPGSIQMFDSDTAQSMFDFQANEVIANIAPRPCLLLHSSDDHVTPVEQSIELFENSGEPTELHLFADTDHFMFAEGNTRVHAVVQSWLAQYFPVNAQAKAA
jgi:alpha-beta hydrolase superfamily lysophospholipase